VLPLLLQVVGPCCCRRCLLARWLLLLPILLHVVDSCCRRHCLRALLLLPPLMEVVGSCYCCRCLQVLLLLVAVLSLHQHLWRLQEAQSSLMRLLLPAALPLPLPLPPLLLLLLGLQGEVRGLLPCRHVQWVGTYAPWWVEPGHQTPPAQMQVQVVPASCLG
jgi:hypothetical protein